MELYYDVRFNPTKSKQVVFGKYDKIDGSVMFRQNGISSINQIIWNTSGERVRAFYIEEVYIEMCT